jgi:hypothetical protein
VTYLVPFDDYTRLVSALGSELRIVAAAGQAADPAAQSAAITGDQRCCG